jgi:hypothetical protein
LLAPAAFALPAIAIVLSSACIASAPEGIVRQTADDGSTDALFWAETGMPDATLPDLGTPDPHAVFGANPTHGPFAGGQRVLIQGKGFASSARVWFGATEVDPGTLVPIDPSRVQVNAPPGTAGPVDLTVQNGDDESTRRTLAGGYVYDPIFAVPSSGPVAGGTAIDIYGQGTAWDQNTIAKIDLKPCTALTVVGPEQLTCIVPQGTPGSKTVSVVSGDTAINILDGYTYEDSENGYKGGLSGDALAGKLKVLVYSNFTGDPIPGAFAIVGTGGPGTITVPTDSTGVALFDDPSLNAPQTVTIAAKCSSPITFVDVPVDTVTVYLDAVATPACAEMGDPPPVGGKGAQGGIITGELVWEGGVEFKKAPWTNVPAPLGPSEEQTAYIFLATSDPAGTFYLPNPSLAVRPDEDGSIGYEFTYYTSAGNRTLYALAGIENRNVSPPKFTAYAMGVVKGLPVTPGGKVEHVYIPMTKTLDQILTLDVDAPAPGPKGPDRLKATVSIMLGNDGFATLPSGQKTPLLPLSEPVKFTFVPPLDGELAGSTYLATARAVTGPSASAPMSVIGRLLANSTSQPIPAGGFVGVPTLVSPAPSSAWDGRHLQTSFAAGAPIDLSVYDIVSGNGLIRWTVAVPKGAHAIELPDISSVPDGSIPKGPITIGIYGARINGWSYGALRYRDLRPSGMTAYSFDTFSVHL